MSDVNTDAHIGSNKRARDTDHDEGPWRFGRLPQPLRRYGCTAKCAPVPMGPPGGGGARRWLPQPVRTTATWCVPMGEAPIGAHRGGVHLAVPIGKASAETPAAPIGKASAHNAHTGMASAETRVAPTGGAAALGGHGELARPPTSDALPRSLPAAVAWLHQQGPTQEAQLAALQARLSGNYDDQAVYRPREARTWATALGVPSCAWMLSHDELRVPVLAAAARVLQQPVWSSPEMAPALAAGAAQLQNQPFPWWRRMASGAKRTPTGTAPTGKVRKVRVPTLPKSDALPGSVPEAMAWLRQQAPTHEAQLAALDARLRIDYDEYVWRRPREARNWARALGVLGHDPESRLLGLKFDHDQLRPAVLAAARAALLEQPLAVDQALQQAHS